ncbi:MAG: DUF6134 family protein [Hyphomicrobium sp.]|jgi:hypothetical protein
MKPSVLIVGLLTLSSAAHAAGTPQNPAYFPPAHLEYAVVRDGEPVGRHVIEFDRQADTTNVKISTSVAVKVAFITVYLFEHSGLESWRGNQLLSIKSQTNDDGTQHQLSAMNDGIRLSISADGGRGAAPATILPRSLWNMGVVTQSTLLNTLDGTVMRISVQDKGIDVVSAAGGRVQAHHYRISGGLDRDVWFDSANTLVRMQFAGKDGSNIVYELR